MGSHRSVVGISVTAGVIICVNTVSDHVLSIRRT